jgi:hypothetical protein
MREALRLLANVRIASRRVAGLAIGTEIQVPLMYAAEVVSTCPLGYPPFSVHPISVFASFVIPGYGPQNFSSEDRCNTSSARSSPTEMVCTLCAAAS